MRSYFLFILIPSLLVVFNSVNLFAQELNCNVNINAQQIQGDKTVFEEMQKAVYEFMNQQKWTNDVFGPQERIECSILINITERISTDEFKGTLQVQSRRPVYNSSYNSTLLNYVDNSFRFKYLQFEVLQFNENNFSSNLTAVLGFYAYMIIGLDYDSFSNYGGTPHYQKALAIVNNAQATPYTGWKAFEGTKNRYWMVTNILDQYWKPLRQCIYKYHRLGFDLLTEKTDEARAEVTNALEQIREVHQIKPNSFNVQLFFNAKSDEIVNLYSQAFQDQKSRVVNLLTQVDPGNNSKYQKILQSD